MTNADKFQYDFGIYATEVWSKSEPEFLKWLTDEWTGAQAKNGGRQEKTDRLDEVIAGVAYIQDALMAHRRIIESGGCNECVKKSDRCAYLPEWGGLVRYNCPFFERGEYER